MRPLLLPRRAAPARVARATEATPAQVVAVGASGAGMYGDPVDNDGGPWRPLGSRGREIPYWTQEKARTYSVAAYRLNPMAKAIIDTYTSFCVGDSGVKLDVTNPLVDVIAQEFWKDPINNVGLAEKQTLGLRSMMLLGETLRKFMVGPVSGVVRYAPHDPTVITEVFNRDGNAAWPEGVGIGTDTVWTVAGLDERTGLRDGECAWWTPFKAIETDERSQPFLSTVSDWLDAYDSVLSSLVDRTALMRYLVWDVTVDGDDDAVQAFIKARGGLHVPRSGGVEVHNDKVKWEPKMATTGAYEDSAAAKSVLTLVAGGAGLSKVWLAEPEDANRATSLTMAEPVRRRIQGVQGAWVGYQAEMVRYAVDRAVAAKRLPAKVERIDPKTGTKTMVAAADTVTVTGPSIAAADSQITAKVLLSLSAALERFQKIGALTPEAAQVAAKKAWEDYMGVPYSADLGKPDSNPDDIAGEVEKANKPKLRAVGAHQGGVTDAR
ncbi:hypothetical protein [Actinophytocola sediminis]